jgi:hypothetical protein
MKEAPVEVGRVGVYETRLAGHDARVDADEEEDEVRRDGVT